MKKRIFTLILALIMCLAIIPASAFAAGSGSISLDKAGYMPNEEIIVTVNGITQQMVDDLAYISIYKAGTGHREYMSWDRPKAGSSQLTFRAPADLGSYEMRLYNEDHKFTDDTFVMSVPFTVGMQKQGKISLEKNAYQALQEISVTVTEITQEMEQAGAFVSIYKKGARNDQWGTYKYVKPGSSVVELTAPNENGEFEMRLFSINKNYSDESFVMSVPFTLSGAVAQQQVSSWAATDLQKAGDLGLIPDILEGKDLTKNITREEFAEVALLMYQEASGVSNQKPVSPNPFVDTANPQVLKAFKQGIIVGYSATEFKPKELINREQVAAILLRVIKMLAPGADYSTAGAPSFTDQKDISGWALDSCLYIAKIGIIRGSDGKFMPRAISNAQQAAGYANTTREQALLMSMRTFDSLSSAAAPAQTAAAPAQTPPAVGGVTGRNASDDYAKIKIGGALDEVIGMLGQGKKVSSETEDFYTWGNVGNKAYIEISFVDGHVNSQGSAGNYQADKYEKIELEMSFDEVVSILGEGKKSKTDINDYYEWKYSDGDTIEITVKGNIVFGKSKY